MEKSALELVQSLPAAPQLAIFAAGLSDWLVRDLSQDGQPSFSESRARALLRSAGIIDDPTLHDFAALMKAETAVRLALFDLLKDTGLAQQQQVAVLTAGSDLANDVSIPWLTLAVAAFAWKGEYPVSQLDPAAPPGEATPAGQLIRRAATFLRQQIQRSATERDKLGRQLQYTPGRGPAAPALDHLPPQPAAAPVPPHYRPPVPVRYPEVARETLQIEADTLTRETAVSRAAPIAITEADLPAEPANPLPTAPIRLNREQARQVPSRPSPAAGTSLATAVRRRFSRDREPLRTTKLRVVVQEVQDGPSLYGVQVHVRCRGIKAHVAGTTNREGLFLCELPVRAHSGLTYTVDVTWPRDLSGDTERKSITLNADRTEFTLPFYRRLSA